MTTQQEVDKINEGIDELVTELDEVCDGWKTGIVMGALAYLIASGMMAGLQDGVPLERQIQKHVTLIKIYLKKMKH